MSYLLETKNLTKRFGRGSGAQTAVDRVSLHVPEGAVYGLLGPNGAGKSTTLKMVAGMLRPTEGDILFAGQPWCRSDLYRIGSLIENPPVYANLTACENLRVRTTLLGIPEARIDEVLQTVDLAATGKKRAGQFSMGMKQRLGIALALLDRPRLLILDEPTNGLDPIGIEELRGLIRSLPAQGVTVVVSSHILTEVSHTADHVGIIAEGCLAYEDELAPGTDLERLFMDVCRRVAVERRAAGEDGGMR
ncbi:lantibiotic protection ABC transporter ATP-binding protein [Paraeggerthella hominis]|uniref:lantibiotic protection ABC transporter ATP-binding protein n=1 Tax=Paraeggerthella hominis TaxID=2897351 RepID=UPI003D119B67